MWKRSVDVVVFVDFGISLEPRNRFGEASEVGYWLEAMELSEDLEQMLMNSAAVVEWGYPPG